MKVLASLGVAIVMIVAGVIAVARTGAEPDDIEERGLAVPTWERHGYRDTDTADALRQIAAVGAGWVQIVPTWYQSARESNSMGQTDSTVDDEDVRQVVALAHHMGLKVLLKPHVDVMDGAARSQIEPTDRAAWFRSYRAFITHYADLAEELGANQFAVGTELSGLSGDRDRWLDVVKDVRSRYDGPILYAANRFEYPTVQFWDAVDLVGIDGYWQLSTQPSATVAELERQFDRIRDDLAAFATRSGHRILFTEAGYPSQVGATTQPWNADQSRVPAPDEQAAAYQALLSSFSGQRWWAGVFWWTWSVQHVYSIDPPENLDYSVRDKPAESVLRLWWAAGAAHTRPTT